MERNIDFINSIATTEIKEKQRLLGIQEKIKKNGINKNGVLLLIKNLSKEQKINLINLYKQQIDELKLSTENYKKKIIEIRNNH